MTKPEAQKSLADRVAALDDRLYAAEAPEDDGGLMNFVVDREYLELRGRRIWLVAPLGEDAHISEAEAERIVLDIEREKQHRESENERWG